MKFEGFTKRIAYATLAAAMLAMSAAAWAASDVRGKDNSQLITHEAFAAPADSADVWFPQLTNVDDVIRPTPVRATQAPGSLLPRERPLIPLPAASSTGLLGLVGVAIFVGRKALLRFVS